MSWTGLTQIKAHLSHLQGQGSAVRNYPLQLFVGSDTALPHARVADGSETVKVVENTVPVYQPLTLSLDPIALQYPMPVSETVVCASDTSLSKIFAEYHDYVIDYNAGTIAAVNGGDIVPGSAVALWYLYYQKFTRDIDYVIEPLSGTIRRLTGGAIEEGQTVLIDYTVGARDFSDDEIAQCITEAEAEIMHTIDTAHHESTDPALQSAATFLALSLLCRNAAGSAASGVYLDHRGASFWLELSGSYRETAERLLRWFRGGPALAHPRVS